MGPKAIAAAESELELELDRQTLRIENAIAKQCWGGTGNLQLARNCGFDKRRKQGQKVTISGTGMRHKKVHTREDDEPERGRKTGHGLGQL